MSETFSTTLRKALRDEYARGFDEGQEAIWEEVVCSVCGFNHDRDESAACDECTPITFAEWLRQVKEERQRESAL